MPASCGARGSRDALGEARAVEHARIGTECVQLVEQRLAPETLTVFRPRWRASRISSLPTDELATFWPIPERRVDAGRETRLS
jgi:hypothetical protein